MASDEERLRQAASSGSLDEVKSILEKGTKQTADDNGDTPLHLATSCYVTAPEYVEVVRALLDHDGDVNSVSKDNNMPIHNSSSNGNMEIVELLLEYGAVLNKPGEDGRLPLEMAALKKHHAVVSSIVKHLIEKKAFDAAQLKWTTTATDESAQLGIFRALAAICQIKEAVPILIQLDIVSSILHGLKTYNRRSVQSHGLQLLQTVMKHPEGITAAKKNTEVKKHLEKTAAENEKDAVISHLASDILKDL